MDGDVIVYIDGLVKRYGFTTALDNISLEIMNMEKILLKGPNGSGKTTLLKIITGLVRPSRGIVEVFGYNPLKEIDKLSRYISFYFEDDPLPWWLDGHSYLEFLAEIQSTSLDSVKELINLLGVDEYWDKRIYTYSSGMKRKIQIVRAFLGNKRLVILDEPLTYIDEESRKKVVGYIKDYIDGGVVIASHIDEGLSKVVDRVIHMDGGRIVGVEHLAEEDEE